MVSFQADDDMRDIGVTGVQTCALPICRTFWQLDGTWLEVHEVLLDKLRGADKIDWSRALIDSSFVRAAYGGEATGPSPVDRAKAGSKHHVITDANGIPLASSVTAANVNDISELAPLFDAI